MTPENVGDEDFPRIPNLPKISDNSTISLRNSEPFEVTAQSNDQSSDDNAQALSNDAVQDDTPTIDINLDEIPVTHEPTQQHEEEAVSLAARDIAAGIELAFESLKPKLRAFVREIYEELTGNTAGTREPDIAYNERQHWLKFAFQLLTPLLLFAVFTTAYVWLTDRILVTLSALVVLGLVLSVAFRYLVRRKASDDSLDNKVSVRLLKLAFVLVTLAVCVLAALVLNQFGVSFIWTSLYLVSCLGLLYYICMLHYMWSQLWFTRDGGVIHAYRPEKTLYFLRTFNKDLFLENVNECDYAQTWIEEKLGIYRIHTSLDAGLPDKKEDPLGYENAKFWRRLNFIVDGAQLRAAIKQGAQYRRR